MLSHHLPSQHRSRRIRALRAAIIGTALAVLAACSNDGRYMRPPRDDQNGSAISIPVPTEAPVGFDTAVIDEGPVFAVSAPWIEGGAIPESFTCRGGDAAPVISWSGAPESTVSYAVLLIDITTTTADSVGFVHSVVYNIDSAFTSLDLAAPPTGAVAAASDFSTEGNEVTTWRGPCPPVGQTHSYVLEVHALDQMLEPLDGLTTSAVVEAIDAATIVTASITASDTGV